MMKTQDDVRRFILAESEARAGKSKGVLAEWSRAIGRNHAYLQQFIKRGTPQKLDEDDRRKLAILMGVPEEMLMAQSDTAISSEDVAASLTRDRDVRSEDVAALIDRGPKRIIRVKGYVGAGGEAHFYNVDSIGDLETIEASDRDSDQTVAARIIGRSLGDFFNGWVITYDDVRSPVTEDLIGELCVVGLSDDRVLVKKIVRNGKRGLFNLVSNVDREPVIEGVRIEWAAKVADVRRG